MGQGVQRSRGGDADVLDLEVFVDALEATLPPETAGLDPSERRRGVGHDALVDPDHAELQRARQTQRPRAIVVVTAHWQAPAFTVGSSRQPAMLYDYHGFPPHTYALRYDAPGDPALAQRIAGLLHDAGLPSTKDVERGFDHGTFIPLMLMFPAADIPVVQLSLRHNPEPRAHLAAGAALAPLRDEGVLIVGSGMSFHNMRAQSDARFVPVAEAFDAWLNTTVQAQPAARNTALSDWESAPGARG